MSEIEDKLRTIQNKYVIGFELEYENPLDMNYMEKELTESDHYWMIVNEKNNECIRFRGVDLTDWSVMFVDVLDWGCFVTVPRDSDVKCIIRFADRYGCKIYFDGELLYTPTSAQKLILSWI